MVETGFDFTIQQTEIKAKRQGTDQLKNDIEDPTKARLALQGMGTTSLTPIQGNNGSQEKVWAWVQATIAS